MAFEFEGHPEHAVGHLQTAVHTGQRLMIPGTREARVSRGAAADAAPAYDRGPAAVEERAGWAREREADRVQLEEDRHLAAPTVGARAQDGLLHLVERLIRLLGTKPVA
jgi:hypothetical protein